MMKSEIEKRIKVAIEAIKASHGTPEGEYGATLFVSHHLAEIDQAYWLERFGTEKPDPATVLDSLVLEGDIERAELDTLYLTLPDDVTNYVMTAHFDAAGKVEEISMES